MLAISSRNMQKWNDVMYMYWYVQVGGLMNWNNLVNFSFSVHIKFFLYIMIINLASLNKQINLYYFFVISFISPSSLDMLVFFSRSHSPSKKQPFYWSNQWTHRVYISANPDGGIMFRYDFNAQSSFIKMERVGPPEAYWCLFTKLRGVHPTIQLPWLQSRCVASECLCVKRSYK